jgi:PAS domain S-box-containing protein
VERHLVEREGLELTMSEKPSLPLSARLLIIATAGAAAGIVIAQAPALETWTRQDFIAVIALALAIAVAEQFSIPLRHRTETVNFTLTDGLWAAALPLARPSVLTYSVAAGVLIGHLARRWAWQKVAFNVGQFVIGISVAEIVFARFDPVGPLTEPATWLAIAVSMSAYFLVNANLVVLVIAFVERKRFVTILTPPLAVNVLHWAGNTALGILAAMLWVASPVGLPLLVIPIVLSYLAYRQWIRSVRERNHMRDLYEAGRALSGPIESTGDFRPFLELLEQMLEARSVELVVLDEDRITVHSSNGTRSLTPTPSANGNGHRPKLEAFVRVDMGLSPQIALIGDGDDARGVVAVYREEPLRESERSLLEALASQISVRLENHKLFFQTFEQAQLAEIVAHTSDGIFVVAHDRQIVSWNPAMERITGYSRAETVGRSCEDVFGLQSLADGSLAASFDPNGTAGEPRDSLVTTKDGERRWIRHTGTPVRDRDGKTSASVVVAHDVTSEVQTEQMKKDFVAMVSHELRTPLTPLKGFLTTLLDGTAEDSPDARHEYYRIMMRQTDRLERLIMDLLNVSQIESGTLVMDMQPVDVTALVADQVGEFREQFAGRAITVHNGTGPILVKGDPFRMQQVVANLISNALKYSPPDQPVEVSVLSIGDEGTVAVRDHGPGILLPDPERVFDRFYRCESGSDPNAGGTGLGLYIARQLIEAMEGRLWLVSRPGEGSTFSFSLPRADVVDVVAATEDGRSRAGRR